MSSTQPGAVARRAYAFRWRHAVLVFLVALGLRGLYFAEASHKPDFNLFYMDEEYNLGWARSLATGVWNPPYDQLRSAPYFRAPLYSYFLAGLIAIFGPNAVALRIVQLVLGSVSCVLAYSLATRVYGERVGLVSGLVTALYWVLVYFDSQLLQPVLLVFLLLGGLYLAWLAAERSDVRLAGLAGLAFGLYAVTRPEVLVFCPFFIWWAVKVVRRAPGAMARLFVTLALVGFLLPPALATVRNRVVSGDWVAVASQGGVNFYIGNNPQSNGMQAVVPGTHESWWGGFADTRAIAEQARGRSLKPSEISDYWFRQGFVFIRKEPVTWLRLTLKKAALFIGNVEIPNNEPYEAHRKGYLTLRLFPLGFGLLLGLFVVALPQMLGLRWLARAAPAPSPADREPGSERHAGVDGAGGLRLGFSRLVLEFMLVYAVTTIAFFVTGRYRVPLVPLVAMGAAVAAVAIWDALRARRLASVAVMVAVATAITVALSFDYFGVRRATAGFAEYTDALDLLDTGKPDEAIARLEAIRGQQAVRAPEFYLSLARAYVSRGRAEDGPAILSVAEEGLRYYPDEPELLWYATLGHVVAKEWEPARDRVERLLAQKPQDIRVLHLAFTIAKAQGRNDDARRFFERAEAADPTNPLVEDMREK
ncbi:MAG TPA: glycosyltransferase family 39 protein [bacterium]|nr:glycosyltransferase family 39 protein [bacterium]